MDVAVGLDLKGHLRTLGAARRAYLDLLATIPPPVYAVRHDGSQHFLNRVGFVYIGEDNDGMEVWRWDR